MRKESFVPKTLRSVAASAALLRVAAAPQAMADTVGSLTKQPSPSATLAQLVQDVGGRGAAGSVALLLPGQARQPSAGRRRGRLGMGGSARARCAAAQRQGVTSTAPGDVLVDVYVDGDARPRGGRAARARHARDRGQRPRAAAHGRGVLPAGRARRGRGAAARRMRSSRRSRRASTGAVAVAGRRGDPRARRRARSARPAPASPSASSPTRSTQSPRRHRRLAGDRRPARRTSTVLSDTAGGTDEGRAMAEIVYDEAPGISGIVLRDRRSAGRPPRPPRSTTSSPHGVKVIADDTCYLDRAVLPGRRHRPGGRSRQGGGRGLLRLRRQRRAGRAGRAPTRGGREHEDFDPGPARSTRCRRSARSAERRARDARAAVGRAVGRTRPTTSRSTCTTSTRASPTLASRLDTTTSLTGMPSEFARIASTGSRAHARDRDPPRRRHAERRFMKYIAFANGAGTVAMEHPTNSGAIGPDAASASGALTVAASDYATPTTPEAFSSRGPVTRLFDAGGNPLADARRAPEARAGRARRRRHDRRPGSRPF